MKRPMQDTMYTRPFSSNPMIAEYTSEPDKPIQDDVRAEACKEQIPHEEEDNQS